MLEPLPEPPWDVSVLLARACAASSLVGNNTSGASGGASCRMSERDVGGMGMMKVSSGIWQQKHAQREPPSTQPQLHAATHLLPHWIVVVVVANGSVWVHMMLEDAFTHVRTIQVRELRQVSSHRLVGRPGRWLVSFAGPLHTGFHERVNTGTPCGGTALPITRGGPADVTRSGLGLCCGRTRSVADVVRSVPNLRSSFLRLVVAFSEGWVYILHIERLRACREFDEAVVIVIGQVIGRRCRLRRERELSPGRARVERYVHL